MNYSCINSNDRTVMKYAAQFDLHPAIVVSHMMVWQQNKEIDDRFPTEEEFKKLLGPDYQTRSQVLGIENLQKITKTEIFKDLGRSIPKTHLSGVEIIKLKTLISKRNNELARNGVSKVYRISTESQGESDNYTWRVWAERGRLDLGEKAQRVRDSVQDNPIPANPLQQGTLDLQKELQTDIRNILLAHEDNRTDNPGTNDPVLGKSITEKLSKLRNTIPETGPEINGVLPRISWTPAESDAIQRFSGKTFKEVLDSRKFTPREQQLYIASRLYQSLHENRLNRAIGSGIRKRLQEDGRKFEVRIVRGSGANAAFALNDIIYLDVKNESLLESIKAKNFQNEDASDFIDIIAFEELIHVVTTSVLNKIEVITSVSEFASNIDLVRNVQRYYTGKDQFTIPTGRELLALDFEYIRALVQDQIVGKTTEDYKYDKYSLLSWVKGVWDFIKDVFTSNKLPGHKKIVAKITEFIKQAERDLGQADVDFNRTDELVQESKQLYSQELLRKLAEGLGMQTGVDFAFITPEQAREILKDEDQQWNGEDAFFHNGKTYFLAGSVTPDDVLHEYVHPIIQQIYRKNPELFQKLFDQLGDSPEGLAILEEVRGLYPEWDERPEKFQEECIVRGVAQAQNLNQKGLESTAGFKKFIDNLLYQIRQLLRKTFGKIKAEDISLDTTLEQLGDMLLEGGVFEIDPEILRPSEIVDYNRAYNKSLQGFVAENANQRELEDLVNEFYARAQKGLVNLRSRKDLGKLAEILQNRLKTGSLETIRNNLQSYQTTILAHTKELEDELELTRQRVSALLNSLGSVDNMFTQIHKQFEEILKDVNDPASVQQALYFQKVIQYWGDFVKEGNRILESNGVRDIRAMNNILANMSRVESQLETFYEKASHKALWNTISNTADNINQKWETRIKDLEARGKDKEAAEARKEFAKEKLTPEKLQDALKGKLKDVSMVGAFLESFAYSPDPVVGGLATYILQAFAGMEARAQARFNEIAQEIKPLMNAAGVNLNKPGELGTQLGFQETIGRVNDETGELEETKAWRFLNQFSGADLARAQALSKIKKASLKYRESRDPRDKAALAQAQSEWEEHRRKYFHTEFTPAFYQAQDLWKGEVGQLARMARQDLYDQLGELLWQLENASSNDILEILEQAESIQREIRQVSSLYDLEGKLKKGQELEIAQRIRQYQEMTRDMYEIIPVEGAFEKAYQAYQQKLRDEGHKPGDGRYEELMAGWVEKNSRVKITDEFWEKRKEIYQDISRLMAKIPNLETLTRQLEADMNQMQELIRTSRDESGQPVGGEMEPGKQKEILEIQLRINQAREKLNNMSGLTRMESGELQELLAQASRGGLNKEQAMRLADLFRKQKSMGLKGFERNELWSLFNELQELQHKEPTQSYLDTINDLLTTMDPDTLMDIWGKLELDREDLEKMNDSRVQQMIQASQVFENWFLINHIPRVQIDDQTLDDYTVWNRTPAWSVIKPNEDRYYEFTTLRDLDGQEIKIKATPGTRYSKKLLKEEFKTQKQEGINTDNRGRWLPRTPQQGAPDDRYMNQEYTALKTNDPARYALLESLKKIHIQNQVGLPDRQKLWVDYPRYEKGGIEKVQDSPLKRLAYKFRTFWQKAQDSWDHGFNFETSKQLVTVDLYDDENSGIPISGLSNIPSDEVSTNIINSVMRYTYAAERSRTLHEINPVARMTQEVVNNPKNAPFYTKMLKNNTLVNPNRRKDKYVRARSVNQLLEAQLEGVNNIGAGSENAIVQNISTALFKTAANAFLNINFSSAIKNAMGMRFQGIVEAAAGTHLRWKEFLAAEVDASAVTVSIMGEIYNKGEPKSLGYQLVEIFDPERDRLAGTYGDALTRTIQKDYGLGILKRMGDFRKTTQLQATLQTFFGMLRTKHIPTLQGEMIRYDQAWQIQDGRIVLKDGIDPTWGLTYKNGELQVGEKFIQERSRMNRVLDNLNGMMTQQMKPEFERYLLGRYLSFFRRFMVSMAMNRFGSNRYDFSLGSVKQGWYLQSIKTLIGAFRSGGRSLGSMDSEEKGAFIRVSTEIGTLMLIYHLLLPMLWGWDDDDKDKLKKIKRLSDALPIPGIIADDRSRPWNLQGWLSNQALFQMLALAQENQQFLPLPGLGLSNIKDITSLKSLILGPTIHSAVNALQDIYYLATGDPDEYYQRNASPYEWAQKGDAKIYSHLGKILGLSGTQVDPFVAIRSLVSQQNR